PTTLFQKSRNALTIRFAPKIVRVNSADEATRRVPCGRVVWSTPSAIGEINNLHVEQGLGIGVGTFLVARTYRKTPDSSELPSSFESRQEQRWRIGLSRSLE